MLRDYQNAAVESVLRALTTSGSAVLQMPTGAGKTKAATEIIKRHDKPVWFICHRQEIEQQAARAFAAAGIDFGIVSPRARPDYGKPVQIVSVATLARRIADMPLPSLAIWDECHHVAAKSWARIREQLADGQNLGLTATPERLDGKGLSEWFNELVVGPSTRELIDAGWLSDFRYFAPSEPDLNGARLRAGDYAKKDLAKVMNTPVLIGDAIAEYRKNAAGKRALVFCASVEASKELVERFNADGIPARHVDGDTPTSERDAAVEALASGEIKVLSNVEVFTEGFDLPAIDAVILLRPTKSLALFLQMIGRVLRKADGKDEALIFDHAGLWLDHDWFDLPIEWSLDGGARQRRLAGRIVGPRRCPKCHEVRPARVEVCACGYEFPTGREIGEYDGVLRELRGAVPEGYCTTSDFAAIYGLRRGTVANWKKVGLPTDKDGYIPRKDGMDWVEENTKLARAARDGFEGKNEFCKRLGVSSSMANKWRRRGMPTDKHGNPKVPEADEWVSINSRSEKASVLKYDGLMTLADIERVSGVTAAAIKRYAAKGALKTEMVGSRTLYDRESVMKWVDGGEFITSLRRPPRGVPNPDAYECVADFGRRVGVSGGAISYHIKRGLPCASNGWVHIQRGLEWVRDNTNIEIPPEAWPSANDNSPASQSDVA